MKKLIVYSYTAICALILFSACSGKGDPLISDVDKESYLSVDVSSLKYDGKGGSNVITIKSNTLWVINSSADWLSFSINSGKGDGTVSIAANENTSHSPRSASIIIIYGQNQQRAISITQEGNAASESLNISPKNINIDGEGGDAEVTITTDASWTVVCEADWLSFSKKTGIGDFTLKITAQKNTKEEIRKATVIILYGDNNSASIDVTQQAKPEDYVRLSTNTIDFTNNGGSSEVEISSNTTWTATASDTWITLSNNSGTGNGNLTITASDNITLYSRKTTVLVTYGNNNQLKIDITQASAAHSESAKAYTVNGVTFYMISLEGGTFTMGGTSEQGSDIHSDETPTHTVSISKFSIGETEVTQALWEAVMGSNPSIYQGDMHPVENISWDDCQTFIKKLNSLTNSSFRLPTEAEWEFAARGGNNRSDCKYAGSNTIDDVAWYAVNSYYQGKDSPYYGPQDVGQLAPNELRLYDMCGNVSEWCHDWYGDYSSASQTNPTGPAEGTVRTYRGGSWLYDARRCRVSSRNFYESYVKNDRLGLRLAR